MLYVCYTPDFHGRKDGQIPELMNAATRNVPNRDLADGVNQLWTRRFLSGHFEWLLEAGFWLSCVFSCLNFHLTSSCFRLSLNSSLDHRVRTPMAEAI